MTKLRETSHSGPARAVSPPAAAPDGAEAFGELVRSHGSALIDLARMAGYEGAAASRLLAQSWSGALSARDSEPEAPGLDSSLRARVARVVAATAGLAPAGDGSDLRGSAQPGQAFLSDGDASDHGHWRVPPSRTDDLGSLDPTTVAATTRAALALLPPMQSAIVLLRDLHGWTAGEVDHALGLDAERQRRYLHLGRASVHGALVRELAAATHAS